MPNFISKAMKENSTKTLIEIIKRLRAPDGCPWDRKQTHKSVRGHLVEECAELLEAIDNDDDNGMREELGDVLMHILLHCEIASEQGKFDFDDVAQELAEKLVRRHPHVFGGQSAKDADEVLGIWQKVKELEHKKRAVGGLFDGIRVSEKSSPDLELGQKIFDCVKEAADKKIEPEGALRDYIAEIKKAYEQSSQK